MRSDALIKTMEIFIYFFPLIVFSSLSIALIKSGKNPKEFFVHIAMLQVLLIAFSFFPPLFRRLMLLNLSQTEKRRLNQSIAGSGLCLLAAVLIHSFLYFNYMASMIPISEFIVGISLGLLAAILSSAILGGFMKRG